MERNTTLKGLVFLTREGCSGSATMKTSLNAALKQLTGWDYEVVDLDRLAKGDSRKGYSTPTLLLNGTDVYGMPAPAGGTDSPG